MMSNTKATLVILLMLWAVALLIFCSGCMGQDGTGIRWAPTETQKQAADLVVHDVLALKPHVPAVAEPIRAEAEKAAKITRAYVGRPQEPLDPVKASKDPSPDPAKQTVLTDAQQAADRPPPTIGDVGYDLGDVILTSLGSMGGIGGLALGIRKMLRGRRRHQQLKEDFAISEEHAEIRASGWEDARLEAEAQADAVDELVGQIEKIKEWAANADTGNWSGPNALADILKSQTFETQKIVSKARLNAGRNEGDV